MKVGRFRIKERIELEVMNQCDTARQAAIDAKTESEAVAHLKKIVRLLCTKWSSMLVFKRDLRRVDKILIAAGFNMEKGKAEYDPNWLIRLTSWIAVHLGGILPYAVGCGMTAKEAEYTVKEAGRKSIQDALRMVHIKISPETMLEDLQKELAKLGDIEPKEALPTTPIQGMISSLKAGYRA